MAISPVFDEVLSPDCNVTIPDAAPDSDAFDPIDTEPVLVDGYGYTTPITCFRATSFQLNIDIIDFDHTNVISIFCITLCI